MVAIIFVVVGVLLAGAGEVFGVMIAVMVPNDATQVPSLGAHDRVIIDGVFLVVAAILGALGNTVVWIAAQYVGRRRG